MTLTKTDFLLFLDSPLHLWAKSHDQAIINDPSLFEQHLTQQGYGVEDLAQKFLRAKVQREYSPGSTITFQAALQDGQYEARVDALVHDKANDTYDIYEIKSSTSVHADHKYDVTFQHLVAQSSLKIYKTYLVHTNRHYVRFGKLDLQGFFVIEDMADVISFRKKDVLKLRRQALTIKNQDKPPLKYKCHRPDSCTCPQLCHPKLTDFSIYDLRRGSRQQYQDLSKAKVRLLKDIPDSFELTYKQRLQLQSAREERPIIDVAGLRRELAQLTFPLYFLDYETYAQAVPLHDNYHPHQQLVFQFSLHVVKKPADPPAKWEHHQFLIKDRQEPSQALAQALLEVIGSKGSIIVWNKSFECGRNRELAELQPQLAAKLHDINNRTYDLMDLFSQGLYVDWRFHGSSSVKKVLPVLAPHLSYGELGIGKGDQAMSKWYEMIYGQKKNGQSRSLSATARRQIADDLLEYCKLDTLAMVEIWRVVSQVVSKNQGK